MTVSATEQRALPTPIESTLRKLIWRVRAAIVLRGVLATLAAALIGILAAMGIATKWLIIEPWQAYLLTGLWLAAAAAAAYFMLLRPLARSFTLAAIARVVEARHPELQERISSTVELLSTSDAPAIRGSESLIRALAAEASSDARSVRPRKEISFRRARPFLYTFAAACAVIAALLASFGGDAGRLLAKTVMPTLNLPNLYAGDLKVTTDPPGRVLPEGGRLEVIAAVTNPGVRRKLRSTEFRLARDAGPDRLFEMPALPDGSFGYTTPPLSRSIRFRVRAGDALSEYFEVKVVPRPAVRGIEIGYDYPDYMQLTDAPLAPARGRISAPAGTLATVRLRLNKPAAAALTINGKPPGDGLTREGSLSFSFRHRLVTEGSGTWRLEMKDEHGFEGKPVEHKIIVTADNPPQVRVLRPGEQRIKLPPRERLEIAYTLGDDFGLSGASLLVAVDGHRLEPVPLPAENIARAAEPKPATTVLDLAKLDLDNARQITFQLRARDNRPDELGGPQEGLSAVRTIELDVKASSYVYQVQLAMDLQIRETLERIHRELVAAEKLSEPLRQSMPATRRLMDTTLKKIDKLREHLATAEKDTRALADATTGGTYPALSKTLDKLANNHIGKARELAGLVKITDQQKSRAELAEQADFHVDRAITIVADLLKKLDVLTELARRALKLQELALRQEELAAAQATTRPAGAEADIGDFSPEQWEEAQRDVARDAGRLARQDPATRHEEMARGGRRSTNLAEMADRLRRQQQALATHTGMAEQIRRTRGQLSRLAAEQAQLAKQVGQLARQAEAAGPTSRPARQAAERAGEAARALTTQPASAIKAQAAAATALDQTAERARQEIRRHAAEQLAQLAERMAKRQEQLAKQSATAEGAQKAAETAQAAADRAAAQQRQITGQVAGRLAALARRQAALAAEARKLESAARPSAPARPAAAMEQAAAALRRGSPQAAGTQAQLAAQQAEKQAGELAGRSPAAAKASEQSAAQAARQAEAARQAATQSTAAAEAARQAETKAAASGSEEDRRAAETARASATAAAQRAQSAQHSAQAASRAAQQARQRGASAAGHAAAARQMAQRQAGLAREIAAATRREAPTLAQAAKAAQETAARRTAAGRARQQLARQLGGAAQAQQGLTRQAGQLRQLAARATPQARSAAARHDPTANMQRAGAELQRSRPTQAAPPQRAAAEQLRRIAKAARPAGEVASPTHAGQVAQAAPRLAAQQRRLQARAAELTRQLARTEAQLDRQELIRLRARQQEIAREAGELSDDVREQAPQADRIDTRAARAASDASREMAANRMARASQAGQRAARALGEMGRRLGPEGRAGEPGRSGEAEPAAGSGRKGQVEAATPAAAQEPAQVAAEQGPTPAERRAELARRSDDLASRQQRVAREAADLAARRRHRVLASRQQEIAQQTGQVRRGTDLIREHIDDIFPDATARRLAQQASSALAQASRGQASAERAMTAGQPGQSVPSQQASATRLGQAAQALRQLGRHFAQQARRDPPARDRDERRAAQQLAEAHEAALEAARSDGRSEAAMDAARAARLLANLARQATGRAVAMGIMPATGWRMGMPRGFIFDSRFGVGWIGIDLGAGRLKELGISPADWAKLPGELRDQVLQAARREGPQEYRSLIRRYFRTIARKGAKAAKPEEKK